MGPPLSETYAPFPCEFRLTGVYSKARLPARCSGNEPALLPRREGGEGQDWTRRERRERWKSSLLMTTVTFLVSPLLEILFWNKRNAWKCSPAFPVGIRVLFLNASSCYFFFFFLNENYLFSCERKCQTEFPRRQYMAGDKRY